jgi:hypothetical protein
VIKVLRDKSLFGVIILIVSTLFVHYHLLVQPIVFGTDGVGFLNQTILLYKNKLVPQAWSVIYFLIIFSQALQLNFLLGNGKMFTKNGFTTALAYILLTAVVKEFSSFSAVLLINSLLIWIFAKIISLYNNPQPKTILFNIGLLCSICIALYPPSVVFVLFIIFGYTIMRPFRITEFFVLLLGLLSVFYVAISILFLQDKLAIAKQFIPSFNISFPTPKKIDYQYWLNIGALFLVFVVGFFAFLPNSNRMVIQSRKNWAVMLLLFVVLCLLSFIFNYNTVYCLLLLIIPISSFYSNSLLYTKKLFFVYVMLLLIISVVIFNNYYWLTNN